MIQRGRSAALVTAVALSLVVAVETPAHAAVWTFSDGFENNPAASWSFENPNNGHGDFGGYDGTPHSGNAYATIYRFVAGWNSVDHSLTLPSGISRTCTVQAYVQEAPGTQFNIEIIDPSNWTYVTMHTYTLPGDWAWHPYSLSWGGGPRTVVLRFVVLSSGDFARIKVDDVAMVCVTAP